MKRNKGVSRKSNTQPQHTVVPVLILQALKQEDCELEVSLGYWMSSDIQMGKDRERNKKKEGRKREREGRGRREGKREGGWLKGCLALLLHFLGLF